MDIVDIVIGNNDLEVKEPLHILEVFDLLRKLSDRYEKDDFVIKMWSDTSCGIYKIDYSTNDQLLISFEKVILNNLFS